MGSLKVLKDSPRTFSISNTNVDRVRVVINVPSLMKQDKETGDIHGNSVSYTFQISTDGGAFTQLGDSITIKGKSKSKYQRATVLTLPKPVTTGWTIKVIRETADSTSVASVNEIQIDSYVEIIDSKLSYGNSAIVGVSIDPQEFSSVPRRSYLVAGLYIRVPSNYDPTSRVYTGIWDGSFKLAVSDSPPWILFDLLTSKRYGLGNHISEEQVDTAMLYRIGRYCDEEVSDGLGGNGKEPRFTINTVIQTRAEAFKLISDITTVFRGMAFWASNMVCFRYDTPTLPSMTFNQANVVDGDFTYSGVSRKDIYSVVHVTWNDPDFNYKQRIEYVEDFDMIQQIGIKKLDTVAFGCTSRGQAHRVGKWLLYTSRFESNLINFKVGLDASLIMPGEVVRILDAFKAGKRMGGRIKSATLNSIVTDAPVEVTSGAVSMILAMPDGSFAERVVHQTNGSFDTFTWSTPLSSLPVENAVFAMSDQIVPVLARVISIEQDGKDPTKFIVTATEHFDGKFQAIENGILLKRPQTSVAIPYVVKITNVSIDETTYFIAPGVIGSKLHISWE
ncbi:MAG: host specificity protein J, partial [Candidatus Binatia bacterium]